MYADATIVHQTFVLDLAASLTRASCGLSVEVSTDTFVQSTRLITPTMVRCARQEVLR